jgi:SSS family solute:Na+ symporter
MQVNLGPIDYVIMAIYVLAVVGIGWVLRSYMKTSSDFLTSGRSIPAWVTGLAFISANLGALELVGMAASGAKYGIATAHFYWVGAIPAMVFLAVFMMPFYYGSKARSVPEYLKMRFDDRVRCLNAITFAVMTVFASGISMNALAKLLHQLLGWDYNLSLWICSAVVLVYVLKGGLTSAIYTEVLQFFMIVLGFAPVVYLGLKDVGGWSVLKGHLHNVASNPAALDLNTKTFASDAWTSAWKPLLGGPSANPMGVDIFAMVFGLGFVLSFGYWCTNFLVVQRAMAAKNMGAARRTPLIAAVPKMIFPILVILPGMLAVALASAGSGTVNGEPYNLPKRLIPTAAYTQAIDAVKAASLTDIDAAVAKIAAATELKINKDKVTALVAANTATPLSEEQIKKQLDGTVAENDYDGVILSLVTRYCPTGLLGLALTALLASFMSGMAGNVTAFNTVWTYDLYQGYIVRNKSDAHYLWMGKAITVVGILLSIACAYFAKQYNNAMDVIQLVFGFVNAPLFATFILGMFWVRTTGTGAFLGLLLGTATSAVFHALTLATGNVPGIKGGYIHIVQYFPSEMAQNFWLAAFAFLVCFVLTAGISLATRQTKTNEDLKGLVYSLTPKIKDEETNFFLRPAVLGTILLIACVIMNYIFW